MLATDEANLTMAQDQIVLRQLDPDSSIRSARQQQPRQDDSIGHQIGNTEFSLPPVDGGRKAWLFLAACWGVEALTFGKQYRVFERQ